jgi:sugar/nucleoside kinase (ribokinase family)
MKPDAYQQLLAEARQAGATISLTGSGHLRIAKGAAIVFAAQTPSDTRATANLRALLRRHDILPPRLVLTAEELAYLDHCVQKVGGRRHDELPPKRLLEKGFVRVAKRSKGFMVWSTEKGRSFHAALQLPKDLDRDLSRS